MKSIFASIGLIFFLGFYQVLVANGSEYTHAVVEVFDYLFIHHLLLKLFKFFLKF